MKTLILLEKQPAGEPQRKCNQISTFGGHRSRWLAMALIALSFATAFGLVTPPSYNYARRTTQLKVVNFEEHEPLLKEISANNLEMTESMRSYVLAKIGTTVERYKPLVTRCDAHLSVNRNPRAAERSDSCEVVVYVKDAVIRAEESAPSMYTAIDLVAAKLARKLRKFKERRQDRFRAKGGVSVRDTDDLLFDEDEDDQTG